MWLWGKDLFGEATRQTRGSAGATVQYAPSKEMAASSAGPSRHSEALPYQRFRGFAHLPFRTLSVQRYTRSRGGLRSGEFFLQLLDDGGIAGGSPFLALLGEFFFQFPAFF
jgi:hypothetical protein